MIYENGGLSVLLFTFDCMVHYSVHWTIFLAIFSLLVSHW